MWASTDPTKKVAVGTDGSYSLPVANHTGSFTITAEYTAADGKYKTSTPKTVTTKGPAIENQDIDLEYGYTTTVTVLVGLHMTLTSGGPVSSDVTVVITAEDGHEVGRGITSGAATPPSAVIEVDHPGRMIITASREGYTGNGGSETTSVTTTASSTRNINLTLYASP